MAYGNTPDEMAMIEREVGASAMLAQTPDERGVFFRSIADSLNLGITAENLPRHFAKVLAFLSGAKDEPSTVRKNNRLLQMIRNLSGTLVPDPAAL